MCHDYTCQAAIIGAEIRVGFNQRIQSESLVIILRIILLLLVIRSNVAGILR